VLPVEWYALLVSTKNSAGFTSVAGVAEGRATLLLVEASDSDAGLFETVLEEAAPSAFKIVRAATLADARSFLETNTADCALVDLGLPDAEGLEVVEKLAAVSPAVALIVLTGLEDDELGVATIATGASDYLSKSDLEGKLLVRSIRFAILRKRFENSLAEAQSIARLGSWEMDLATDTMTWSRELHRLYGFGPDEKPSFEALLERTHPEDRESARRVLRSTLVDNGRFVIQHRLLLPDESVRWVRSMGRVELDAALRPQRLLGTAQDITEQKRAEEALVYQATHTPLIGLPNRVLFLERVGQALGRLTRQPSTVAVVYLDVDRFRVVNDSLGRAIGDQLLIAMGGRLRALVAPGDTLARPGGDEFAVLCEGLSGQEEAVAVADGICAAMTEPLAWDEGELVLSVSAGIAVATSPLVSADSLLRDAEAAMYSAKSEGRGRTAVFAETMRAHVVGRLDTEVSLRRAIAGGRLDVHYQQIVNVVDGAVLGHEALVRWDHPTKGLLQPDQFITVAEETGLIVPLGAFVLQEACRQATLFQGRGAKWSRLTMAVNLSGGQLCQTDLVAMIATALNESDLKPEYLELEMTETLLMDDAASTISILTALKGLGVRLSVDDFGTGYSSLAYLKRFPVDVLKIDGTFVRGLGKDLEDSAVAAAIVSLADALGLTTIAEGVETNLQQECLIGLGCARAQGYLFAGPLPAAECEAALDGAPKATVGQRRRRPSSPRRR
jgi:diguanylate cyclase (GGDEF)-like protein/PAS domain S-box-containing protein